MNYDDEEILTVGGSELNENNECVASKKFASFSLFNEQWSDGPQLNRARTEPAGCCMSSKLYVFGGIKDQNEKTLETSIEILVINSEQEWWQLLDEPLMEMFGSCACQLTANEMIIVGGAKFDATNKQYACSDVLVFDIEQRKTEKVITSNELTMSANGSIVMASEGKTLTGWVDEFNKKALVVSITKDGENYSIQHIETHSYSASSEDEEEKADQP